MTRSIRIGGAALLLLGFVTAGIFTRHQWLPWLTRTSVATSSSDDLLQPLAAAPNEQVKLSPQAKANLGLTSRPLQLTTYWKTISIPATVVDRPGVSDRGVVAPITGVVIAIHRHAGDVVQPGEPLFVLRLAGDGLQTSQTELFKTIKNQQITQDQIDRLSGVARSGAIAQSKLIELRDELRRTGVAIQAHRQELQIRGLTPMQIDSVADGTFVSEVTVAVPALASSDTVGPNGLTAASHSQAGLQPHPASRIFEVQELTATLGQQVQAGQRLCTLSHHQSLFIEGRAFQVELPLLQRAAEDATAIHVESLEETEAGWPEPIEPLKIHHIANTLNDDHRTVSFYLALDNQYRTYQRNGETLFLWRFRPGQRVRLHVRVEQLENVFVLPSAAVVKEGPESYIFRHNGDFFDRRPVHVLHQSRDQVVIANDGSVSSGIYVAQAGAIELNRVLNSQSGSAPSGVHVHADGSVHTNH